MDRYPARRHLNRAAYGDSSESLQAYYGLPRAVAFCRRCGMSNQRPSSAIEFMHTRQSKKSTIAFDDDGVCSACKANDQKKRGIDWTERERELRELCDRHRKTDGSYDCLVPGSGGKDSFYAAHVLKYRFGMNPLTVTWSPALYTDWGWKNFQSWIHAGFDNVLFTPNGRVHRLLTRLAVENLFHPFQPFILGQKAFVPKMALRHEIPLVFYGESEAEYGNPIAEFSSAKRDFSYFATSNPSDVYLGGISVAELEADYGLSRNALQPYIPADPALYEAKGVEVHYLGYYMNWHPQGAYYYAAEHGGFRASAERSCGSYSKYNSIDDKIDDFHYYTTYVKFGFGRASEESSQEVRNGEITLEEALALVERFDGEYPARFADEVFEYLSLPPDEFPEASRRFEQPVMDRAYFDHLADDFRSPHLWVPDGGEWRLRHTPFLEKRRSTPRVPVARPLSSPEADPWPRAFD